MAKKEIYRLDIKVGVSGDGESKSKLSAIEKMTQQTEKKMKALNKVTVSPSARITDNMSSTLTKIKSKATVLNNTKINPTAKITDNASNRISQIMSNLKRLDASNCSATIRIKDEASTAAEKIHKKTEKLKDSVPTVRLKAEDQASSIITKVQNKLNSWIKTGAKKVIAIGTAGVLATGGIGLATSIKTYSEYEKGLSNVKAVTSATDTQMQQLDTTAKKLGSTTSWSARHVTQAEELLGQAGFSVQETITALPGLLNLASAGDLDLAAATDIASGTLRAFNLNANQSSHVADVLALSAAATNSDVADLGETLKYVAPVSQALGISLEDTAAASGLLSNANIKGSQAGTILRQTMARLASPSKEAAKVMKQYGINAFDVHGNMKPLSSVVDNLTSSLSKLTSQQRADVISTVFGTESMSGVMALMNQGGKSVSDLSKQLKDANGASQEMADIKLDNLNGQWIRLKAAVEHTQITLGEKLAPYAKQFVNWLTGKMPAITDGIVNIVDTISNNIGTIKVAASAVLGLTTAFVGMSTVNKVASTFSTFKGLLSGLTTAKAATGITEVTGAIKATGLAAKIIPAIFSTAGFAIAAVGIMGLVTAKQLSKEVIPQVDLFADKIDQVENSVNGSTVGKAGHQNITKISDATKEAVGAYEKMNTKVKKSLLDLRYTNATITSDIATDIGGQFSTMGSTITTKLDKDLSDSVGKTEKFFSNSKTLTSTEQTDILTQLQGHYANKKKSTESAMNQINTILTNASNEKRVLTQDEYNTIDQLQHSTQISAITTLSSTEAESAVILGRIKDSDGRITAETAGEHVKALEDQRLKTIDAANTEYAERVRIAEAIRSEGGSKAEETASKIIGEAQRQRDDTISAANKTKSEGLDLLKKSYADLENDVNTNTGQILDCWGRLAHWWHTTVFGRKEAIITTGSTVVGMAGQAKNTSSWKDKNKSSGETIDEIESDLVGSGSSNSLELRRESGRFGGIPQNYTGTTNGTSGINSVAERGMELVLGSSLYNFTGGEKVLNNKQTTDLLKPTNEQVTDSPTTKANKASNSTEAKVFYLFNNEYKNDTQQSGQGQYQVATPQLSMAGSNNIKVDVQNNIDGGQDIDAIIAEATKEFGRKLKEALTNIIP